MTRSTAEELGTRIEEAADLLSEGWPGRYVVKTLAEKHQVSHQQARKYVREEGISLLSLSPHRIVQQCSLRSWPVFSRTAWMPKRLGTSQPR